MDECKVMHIGHELPTVYATSDRNNTTQLETMTDEKDLGVWVTKDLKPTNFRIIYIRPHMSDHISSTVFRHGHHSYRRIKSVWENYKRGQPEWSKDSRNFHMRPDGGSRVFSPWTDEDYAEI